jgi:hypothetical protein
LIDSQGEDTQDAFGVCFLPATFEFYVGLETLRSPHEEHCGPSVKSHGMLDNDPTLKLGFRHGAPFLARFPDTGAAWQGGLGNAN